MKKKKQSAILLQMIVADLSPKNDLFSGHSLHSRCTDDVWQEASIRTTIRAENEVEAHKLANNYRVCKYELS